ncbi:MBL fold metallo-hydrolase [uncultured Thiohalocapsa sp.]|uniref:MBL fold metallo-hydrolase n=1 Tax=uncultured Thiohalocapsa sp. TaxID=768990 RepID=UPI0025D69CC7|nr:MBL fold metallo-hydrolase [uncultured Thiohalocapsa sp.]
MTTRAHRFAALLMLLAVAGADAGPCEAPVAVQVLGSGGPEGQPGRASAGYLVWLDGKARVLLDIGGGSFARFGASGARFADLHLIALTHLHADHATDLPALLKSGYFSPRTRALAIAGPTGGGDYPDLEGYLHGLFGPGTGAFRYLAGSLDGSNGLVALRRRTLDADSREPMPVHQTDAYRVSAVGVTHGPVPALAYRVDAGEHRIVFSGDMNGDDPWFADFARGADLLIMDHAVPVEAGPVAARLHALPSEIAAIAKEAEVGHLVLSHLMRRSERALDDSLARIGRVYPGTVSVAEDLDCFTP